MDLFVLPSLREGISNTILEAMATGLPVVATRVGGNAELVEAGRTGDLVPHGDPLSLAHAIERYFCAPEKAAEHGSQGRCLAEEKFGMAGMVAGYLKAYDAVMRRGSSEAASAACDIAHATRP
jgi:glycosyltransferase involved in cell wall biosynthesis